MVKKLVSYDTDTGELSTDVEADLAQRFAGKLSKADADATYAPVEAGVVFIQHGSDVNAPRGTAPGRRIWVGTVKPTAFLDGVDLLLKPTTGAVVEPPPAVPTSGLVARWTSHEATGPVDGAVTAWPAAHGSVPLTLNGGPTLRNADGRRYVELDGVDDYLSAAFGSSIAQPSTTMIVGRYAGSNFNTQILWGGTTGATVGQTIGTASDGRRQIYAGTGRVSTTTADGGWHLHHASFNGTTSDYSLDGASIAAGAAGANALDGVRIGANSAITSFFKLHIAEVLVWNRLLTAQEKSDVSSALIAYYGI